MKLYKIQDREAGNIIEENLTLEEAKECVKKYEEIDKSGYWNDGVDCYVPDFYEIKEMEEDEN